MVTIDTVTRAAIVALLLVGPGAAGNAAAEDALPDATTEVMPDPGAVDGETDTSGEYTTLEVTDDSMGPSGGDEVIYYMTGGPADTGAVAEDPADLYRSVGAADGQQESPEMIPLMSSSSLAPGSEATEVNAALAQESALIDPGYVALDTGARDTQLPGAESAEQEYAVSQAREPGTPVAAVAIRGGHLAGAVSDE